MTKPAELRELTADELEEHLEGSKKELFNLRFQLATGRLDNVARIETVRREIARVRTLQGERSRAEGAGAAGEEE